ncbi:MAG: penicillin-insensitive murein endopeptidase [Nannocystales bacterium]
MPSLPLMRLRSAAIGLLGLAIYAWSAEASAKGKPKKTCEVEVASGDTLSGIAAKHGVSEKALISGNPALKKNPNLLRVGQVVSVCVDPPDGGGSDSKSGKAKGKANASKPKRGRSCEGGGEITKHEVASGDTLSRIARTYAVKESSITRHNKALRADPNKLRVGQEINVCVSGGSVGSAKKSKACDYITPVHTHTVVPGEHLGQVAGRYGVRKRDLTKLNARLRKNPDMLRVGQSIRVCPVIAPRERTKISYTVQSGDNLGTIAQRYGLTPSELERYQRGKLKNPNALREGQSLTVWADGDVVEGFARIDRDKGKLKAGVQLPPGRHYVVKWEAGAWGTGKTVRVIQSAVASYKRKQPGGPKVHIGDISKRGGGKFRPHLSHQHGRDVDIGYVLEGKYAHEKRFHTAVNGNLDIARTWTLIKAFVDSGEVTYIFMDYRIQEKLYKYAQKRGYSEDTLDELFQYPRGKRRTHGLIRHWKGHHNHFHVRFRK